MMNRRDDTGGETPVGGCEAFEVTLPDYLDDALAPDAAREAAAHVAACATCRELVRDLRGIRAQAGALPVLRPSRDLWQGIEARIASPSTVRSDAVVVQSAPRPGRAQMTALRRWFGSHSVTRVSTLAAAGLVIATAGLTYVATRALTGPQSHVVPPEGPAVPSGGGVQQVAQTSEYLYDAQIASLHKILEQRRARLDPKTVAVIEHNLSVIDTAIAQSKRELEKDPANAFLADQLDRNLDTKLELLRTVALLPSST
jgi:hypothetical protein